MINMQQTEAIYKLYPQVISTNGDIAYDANGNEVTYDLQAINAKVAQDEADKTAQEQAQATAKQSALAKLAALGLSENEVKALVG